MLSSVVTVVSLENSVPFFRNTGGWAVGMSGGWDFINHNY